MKKIAVLILSLLLAGMAFACSPKEVIVTEDAALKPEMIAGLWKAKDASFSFLFFSENGAYEMQNAAGQKTFSGSFVVEGDYVILDGYGVDDPDRGLILVYLFDNATLSGQEGNGTISLSRAASEDRPDRIDYSVWYGAFSSDQGRAVIGPGAGEGTALIAVTPKEGATLSASISFDSADSGFCDLFILSLDGDVLTLEGLEEESLWVTGDYLKEES